MVGRGAGMMPTAVAVVSDLIEIARNMLARASGHVALRVVRRWAERPMRDIGLLSSRYYLRFAVEDRPGVLAHVFRVLYEAGVNVEEVENIPYHGAQAAAARVHVSGPPAGDVVGLIKSGNADIISVDLTPID